MGVLVAMAGVDGAGKSTLCASVADRVRAEGLSARVVKIALFANPAFQWYRDELASLRKVVGSPVERRLRAALVTLETARTVQQEIVPALASCDVVICDRYTEGSASYLVARRLPPDDFDEITPIFPRLDLGFLLDLPVAVTAARLRALGEAVSADRIAFLEEMRSLLLAWSEREGAELVDARRSRADLAQDLGDKVVALAKSGPRI